MESIGMRLRGDFAVLTVASAQPPKTEDSPRALVEMALQRNREYLAARAKITEADALLRQAGIRPTPSIEIEGASGQLLGSQGESAFSAAYFHTIETGGKRDKRIQVAEKAKAVAQAEVDEYRRQLTFEVKTRYFELLAEERKLSPSIV